MSRDMGIHMGIWHVRYLPKVCAPVFQKPLGVLAGP